MPVLGYDMTEGRIASWLKAVGEDVSRGEALAEIETDKATVEFESLLGGRLVEIVHDAGENVAIGDVIAYIESAG